MPVHRRFDELFLFGIINSNLKVERSLSVSCEELVDLWLLNEQLDNTGRSWFEFDDVVASMVDHKEVSEVEFTVGKLLRVFDAIEVIWVVDPAAL